jgi:excisionase family DNA binding protein
MPQNRSELVSVDEAAPILRRHPVTLRKNLRDGSILGVKVGGRWFLRRSELDRILNGEPRVAELSLANRIRIAGGRSPV